MSDFKIVKLVDPISIQIVTSLPTPFSIPIVTVDPAPVAGNVLLYALSDGVESPNNAVTVKLLWPNGDWNQLGEFLI